MPHTRICAPCEQRILAGQEKAAAELARRPSIHRGGVKERLPEIGGRINVVREVVKRGPGPEAVVTDESFAALKEARLLIYGTNPPAEGFRPYRNNNGHAKVIPYHGAKPHPLVYGLGSGTADFVGILAPFGMWASLEMKAPGETPTEPQWKHIHEVRSLGGWADYSDSAERTVRLVREAIEWARGRAPAPPPSAATR